MSRYVFCNPNPMGKSVGDCVIRAVSIALNQSWSNTYWDICEQGFKMCDMPSANSVWGEYLRERGFTRITAPRRLTVAEFCREYPRGVYVLGCDSHVVCTVDGRYYDAWNSGNETVNYFFTR